MSTIVPTDFQSDPQSLSRWEGVLPDEIPNTSFSQALESVHQVVAGPARLYGFGGFNNKASSQFIQVFDSQTLPGANAVPVFVIIAQASSNFGVYWGSVGRWFYRGIVLANSSTVATLTAGAADCFFDAQFV